MYLMTSNPPEATIMPTVPPEDPGGQMTFFEHLVELRKRIITSLIAVGIGAGVGWFVAPHFVSWITKPMLKALADQHLTQQLVYTNPTGFLSLLISLSIYLGIVLASPVVPLISINEYFDLTLMVLLGAGLIFELPVLIFFLTLFGIVTPKFLFVNSKYAILVIAIIAAIITPTPDALTMLVVMAPMVVLYFAGIGVSALVVGKRNRRLAAAAAGTPAAEAH